MYLITTRQHGPCRKFAIERVKVLRCVCLRLRKGEISAFGLGRMRSPRRSIEHGSRDAVAADVYRHRARVRGLLLLVSAWPLSGPFDCWYSTCVHYSTSVLVYSQAPYLKKGLFFKFFSNFCGRSATTEYSRPDRTRFSHAPIPAQQPSYTPSTYVKENFQLVSILQFTSVVFSI